MSLGPAFAHRGVVAERELAGGHRNRVFLVRRGAERLVAKTTGHSEAGLLWLLPVLAMARHCGLGAPLLEPDGDGLFGGGGLTLEPFLDGRRAGSAALHRLGPRVARFHARLRHYPARPGLGARGEEPLPSEVSGPMAGWLSRALRADGPVSVVHGDVTGANCIETGAGLALIDWDECRRDLVLFDLPLAGATAPVRRARLAAEIVSGWTAEPAYARRLLARARVQAERF